VVSARNAAGQASAVMVLTVTAAPAPISLEAWRVNHFGASATDAAVAGDDADPDADGISNADEFRRGSDPLD